MGKQQAKKRTREQRRLSQPELSIPAGLELRQGQLIVDCQDMARLLEMYQDSSLQISLKRGAVGDYSEQFFQLASKILMQTSATEESHVASAFICLASLLSAGISTVGQLSLTAQLKNNIKRALSMVVGNQNSRGCKLKQAILYLLALLIHTEQRTNAVQLKRFNDKVFNDQGIIGHLLCLKLTASRRLGKMYSIIIVYYAGRVRSRRAKERLTSSILLNIGNLKYEPGLLKIISYLRSEKDKVAVSYTDIVSGGCINILVRKYSENTKHSNSFPILDYLNHLLSLFPRLSEFIPQQFISYILEHCSPEFLHHPFHEAEIISVASIYLRCVGQNSNILDKLMEARPPSLQQSHKLGQLLLINCKSQERKIGLFSSGYSNHLLLQLRPGVESHLAIKIVLLIRQMAQSIGQVNPQIESHLLHQLAYRLLCLHRLELTHQIYLLQQRREHQFDQCHFE